MAKSILFKKDYDTNRDSILSELGLRILRINNEECEDMDQVLNKIRVAVNSTHPPAPSLQSREGVSERSKDGGEFSIIILAAGPSSRMGQPKQQLLVDGKTLLTRASETALQSKIGNVIVVLGAAEEVNRQLLREMPLEIILNPLWKTGMGSSLKAGLSYALTSNPRTKAIIVMVCDQPLVQSNHLKLLVEKYKSTQALLVASAYSNTKGVPALFDSKLFDSLLKLEDAHGAKKTIQQHPSETINFPEGAVDIDTPEEYNTFLRSKK